MGGCAAINCYNSGAKGFCMVRFPREESLRMKWLQGIGRPNWTPHQNARVCEVHFSQDQWIKFKSRLASNAIPKRICTCDVAVKRASKMLPGSHTGLRTIVHHDHPYAVFVKSQCPVHSKLPAVSTVLKENCALQEELHSLKQQLQNSGKDKAEVTKILASVENINKIVPHQRNFSPQEIQRGLSLRFACGSTAYEKVIETFPAERIPSVRSLNRHTQHVRLLPGLHDEIFEAMKTKFEVFTDPRDSDCNFIFDEMAVQSRVDYDPATKTFFGYGTLPGQGKDVATKAECYMLRGTHKHWKQLVGYNLTCKEGNDEGKKAIVMKVLQKAEELGLYLIAIVCDMGNRGLLAKLGFSTQKKSLKWSIANPINAQKKLWCMPDPVHVYKSLADMLCKNDFLVLPPDIVKEYSLPSEYVSLEHIKWLEKFQRDEDLLLVPSLTVKDLHPSHFSKMKVKPALNLLGHPTSAALKYLVLRGLVPEAFETTAWFIKLMIRWFQLVTSRSLKLSFGHKDMAKYDEAIEHLKLVIRVFRHSSFPGGWKPVQSHVIFASESTIEIQYFLLNERKYTYVLMGCFSSDVIENVFSVMRLRKSNPTPLEFKHRYKHMVLSQYSQEIRNSSYHYDDAPCLVDTLLQTAKTVDSEIVCQPFDVKDYPWIKVCPPGARPAHQDDILYRMCGYVINSLKNRNILKCPGCISRLRHSGSDPHPHSLVQVLMDFKEGAQFPASNEIFEVFRIVEYNLLRWIPKLQETRVPLDNVVELIIKPQLSHVTLQTCHDIKDRLLSAFTVMRFRQIAFHKLSPLDGNSATSLASKTAGSTFLAKRYNHPSSKSSENNHVTPTLKRLTSSKKALHKTVMTSETPKARHVVKSKNSNCKSPSVKRLLNMP